MILQSFEDSCRRACAARGGWLHKTCAGNCFFVYVHISSVFSKSKYFFVNEFLKIPPKRHRPIACIPVCYEYYLIAFH